jgi:tetratricopeptide (TPR) repeat protein
MNTNHDMALLRLADKLVRNGDLQGALSSILKAREVDPSNRYAEAYEERVRGLLKQQGAPEAEETVVPQPAAKVVVDAAAALNRRLEEIQSILNDVNSAIIRNDFPEALEFIGKARELDPANDDFAVLEEQVRAAVEGASSIAEDPPVYYEVVKSTLDAYVAEAVDLAARADFDEALHLVTKGFVLDPTHEGLRDAERYINVARQIQEAQKKSTSIAEQHYRLLVEREHEAREELAGHIKTARVLLRNGAFDEALTEIALGYTIDAQNEELQEIERSIWQTRASAQTEPEIPPKQEEVARLIRLHILAAEEFAKNGDFVKALDGLAKAYVIDPANTEIKRTEVRIRQAELRHHQASGSPLKLVYYHDRVVNGE